jgi:predicted RNase H-like nuclease
MTHLRIAGVDGCKGGWVIAASNETLSQPVTLSFTRAIAGLLAGPDAPDVLAVDIPIGLTGSGDRAPDSQARKLTPPGSVFQAAKRPILGHARDHGLLKSTPANRAALREWCRSNGHAMSGSHSYALYERTAELDALVRFQSNCDIREVHPEVCFWALNGEKRLIASKKTARGLQERRRLLNSAFTIEILDLQMPHSKTALDDVFDALAALWTAARIARDEARHIPEAPGRDLELNRDIAIWY